MTQDPTQDPTTSALREALDDLWACIGHEETEHLQPETIQAAKDNHEYLWHAQQYRSTPANCPYADQHGGPVLKYCPHCGWAA